MKNLVITLSIMFAFQLGSLFGQTADPIMGEWINSYNSVLTISSHSPETGFFEGTYSSSTGATGKYAVSGYSPYMLTTIKGIPISFAINWKTLPDSNNKETPDQEWTSTMAGSLIINKEGEVIIQVFHSLNASLPLGSVQIDTHGRYSETLIFKQKSTKSLLKEDIVVVQKSDKHYTDNTNPLLGIWSGTKSEYMLEITNIADQSGLVDGFYQDASGRVPVKGYTAVSPSGNYQSVSLSFMSLDKKYCFAMGGFLNNDRNLELMVYKAKAVVIANNYSSVNVYKNNFIKSSFYGKNNKAKRSDDKIVIAMSKNPFTNNGASEWTGLIPIGTSKQLAIPRKTHLIVPQVLILLII